MQCKVLLEPWLTHLCLYSLWLLSSTEPSISSLILFRVSYLCPDCITEKGRTYESILSAQMVGLLGLLAQPSCFILHVGYCCREDW